MNIYGIIGKSLVHSFSPTYFNAKFEREQLSAQYVKFELQEIAEVNAVLTLPNLKGLNVTIPYKQAIMPYLDAVTPAAQAIGAVNCITKSDGLWVGHNTDVIGFEKSLTPYLQAHHQRALVLGTGGAAKAVEYVLQQLQIPYQLVSRTNSPNHLSYDAIAEDTITQYTLIINTTPLGMYPNLDACPKLPYHALSDQHLCYDLIYNPEVTLFLAKSKAQGATIVNGEAMLLAQAEAGWAIWNAKK